MKNAGIRPDRVRTDGVRPMHFDAEALADELRTRIRGEVRFDAGTRALYTTDGSNYRQVPIGVVLPTGVEDVIETVAACPRLRGPILSPGGGSRPAGPGCNAAGVVDIFQKKANSITVVAAKKNDQRQAAA